MPPRNNILDLALNAIKEVGVEGPWTGEYVGTYQTAVHLTPSLGKGGHALATVFRPVGVLHDGCQDRIQRARAASVTPNTTLRYSLEARKHGKGAGAIELHGHSHVVRHRRVSRMELLLEGRWADEDPDILRSTHLGSLGVVARELSPHLRGLLYNHKYVVPYYSLSNDNAISRSVTVMLLVWGLEDGYRPTEDLAHDLDVSHSRTHPLDMDSGMWSNAKKAHFIVPGYAGASYTD